MLAFALLLAPAAAPAAAPPAKPEHVITNPDWLRRPTGEQLANIYPAKAMESGMSGQATMVCRVVKTGGLESCHVTKEAPEGLGFAQAVLALSQFFLMRPRTVDGVPVEGGEVTIPIRFSTDGGFGGAFSKIDKFVAKPVWDAAPTRADVAAAYPARALAKKVAGRAAVRCAVGSGRALAGCEVVTETPFGSGFGGAAVRLASRFRLGPVPDDKTSGTVYAAYNVAFTPELAEAEAQHAPLAPPRGPEWSHAPTAEEASATFPQAARKAGVLKGAARVRCTVKADGWLSDCAPVSETPEGLGFGAAAAGLATRLRMSLWTAAGSPTAGAQLVMPLAYDLTDSETAPTKP